MVCSIRKIENHQFRPSQKQVSNSQVFVIASMFTFRGCDRGAQAKQLREEKAFLFRVSGVSIHGHYWSGAAQSMYAEGHHASWWTPCGRMLTCWLSELPNGKQHTKTRTDRKGKTIFKNTPQWPTFAHPAPPYTFTISHYVIISWIHQSIYLLIRSDPPRFKHFPAARLPLLWQLSTHNESIGTVHVKPWELLKDLWDISLFVLFLPSAPSLSKRKKFTVMLWLCTLGLKCQ